MAREFLDALPLPEEKNVPVKLLSLAIEHVQKTGETLVIVSSICPSYSTDVCGVPTYKDLEVGISPNTQKHFDYLVPAVRQLVDKGVPAIHFFLMADTEVDLLPFLTQLDIDSDEFTNRCQQSVEMVGARVISEYNSESYQEESLPPAARFIDYFGHDEWFERYYYFKGRLMSELEGNPYGNVARGLKRDYQDRSILIKKLLGNVAMEDGIAHIARQKAQYMAFASLMRERFGKRLVIVNHRTPNFAWMNDKITREPIDRQQLAKGNYHHKLPLIELDISTMPEN